MDLLSLSWTQISKHLRIRILGFSYPLWRKLWTGFNAFASAGLLHWWSKIRLFHFTEVLCWLVSVRHSCSSSIRTVSNFMRRNAFPQVLMQATAAKLLHNIRITAQENSYLRIKVLLGSVVKGFTVSVQKLLRELPVLMTWLFGEKEMRKSVFHL